MTGCGSGKRGWGWLPAGLVALVVVAGGCGADLRKDGLDVPIDGPLENPRIVVEKSERRLVLYEGDREVRRYRVGLGRHPEGDKEVEGDGRTPEGRFYIWGKNPESSYHLGLNISYPSREDAERGLAARLIDSAEYRLIVEAVTTRRMPPQKTALGGEIVIHGGGTLYDWTLGCIALANDDMTELYEAVKPGTPIEIVP